MQILAVDDDEFSLNILQCVVRRLGHEVVVAHDGNEAMQILRRGQIRLVITDWEMPGMDGIELCRTIRNEEMSGYVYIILLTGHEGEEQRMSGLNAGSDDFINKPLDQRELRVCLKRAERILALETRDVALFSLAKLAESRDPDTGAHVERVQSYARVLARQLLINGQHPDEIDDEFVRLVYQTSPLHDLGKVGIPDSILLKPGKLDTNEFAIMKAHTHLGAQTLEAALQRFPSAKFLQMARDIAATHHEKWDGTGYPRGLSGRQIPMCGRIVALADVYDALTSKRVYKDALSHEKAREIIIEERTQHFDPDVVDAFLKVEDQFVTIRESILDPVMPTLPEAPVMNETPPAARPQRSGDTATVLLVEDDPTTQSMVQRVLESNGYEVLTADSGRVAIEMIEKHRPRVVVSDWMIPAPDGIEICRYLRREEQMRPNESPVYFIMLTSRDNKEDLVSAYEAGVNDFIGKPFHDGELLSRVGIGTRTMRLHDDLTDKHRGSQRLNAQLSILNDRLEKLAIADDLTGLFNRRHAVTRLEDQWAVAERYNRPITVALIDIDLFKQINDEHGHDIGDNTLRCVAGALREVFTDSQAVCRMGGDEFLVILPGMNCDEASALLNRVPELIARRSVDGMARSMAVTLSIGVAERTADMGQFSDLMKCADEALYSAKRSGRNTISIWQTPLPDEAPPAPAAGPAPFDYEQLAQRCGNRREFIANVLTRFGTCVTEESRRLREACSARDLTAVKSSAHSLRGAAGFVGAEKATALAAQLESLDDEESLNRTADLLTELEAEARRIAEFCSAAIAQTNSQAAA